jgi:hypothetical protein
MKFRNIWIYPLLLACIISTYYFAYYIHETSLVECPRHSISSYDGERTFTESLEAVGSQPIPVIRYIIGICDDYRTISSSSGSASSTHYFEKSSGNIAYSNSKGDVSTKNCGRVRISFGERPEITDCHYYHIGSISTYPLDMAGAYTRSGDEGLVQLLELEINAKKMGREK